MQILNELKEGYEKKNGQCSKVDRTSHKKKEVKTYEII